MKLKFTLLALAAVILGFGTGCHLFSKSKKTNENAAIASDVEADFQRRWVDRRTAELTAAGTDANTARQQANTEFREKFTYLKPGGK